MKHIHSDLITLYHHLAVFSIISKKFFRSIASALCERKICTSDFTKKLYDRSSKEYRIILRGFAGLHVCLCLCLCLSV